jgi:glutamate racemase
VDNEIGIFSTKAVIEGNVLKMNIKKMYKQTRISKDNFSKMLEFIDAAYNFSQRRILLKKN